MKKTIILRQIKDELSDSKAKKIAINYAQKLEKDGWHDVLIEGAVFSPDGLAAFYYGRVPYIGQIRRCKSKPFIEEDLLLEKDFFTTIQKYLETDDFIVEDNTNKEICGKLSGYVPHEQITNYIREHYDENVIDTVKKYVHMPLSRCNWTYTVNEHSEDSENYYSLSGVIEFKINGNPYKHILRYLYTNITTVNQYTNPHYFRQILESETTQILTSDLPGTIELLKDIISHCSGGWVSEDNESGLFYSVEKI